MMSSVTLPPLPKKKKNHHHHPNSIRFLGLLKLHDTDTDTAPDLDEIWPSDDVDHDHPLGPTSADDYPSSPGRDTSPVYSSGFGLSSVLGADDRPTDVRRPARRSAMATSMARSAPVNVPTWRHVRVALQVDDVEMGSWDEDDEEEEMIPPHVIVGKSHVTTFSVFEGVGRTLKGRDLRRVRNAVFQKTGFLD